MPPPNTRFDLATAIPVSDIGSNSNALAMHPRTSYVKIADDDTIWTIRLDVEEARTEMANILETPEDWITNKLKEADPDRLVYWKGDRKLKKNVLVETKTPDHKKDRLNLLISFGRLRNCSDYVIQGIVGQNIINIFCPHYVVNEESWIETTDQLRTPWLNGEKVDPISLSQPYSPQIENSLENPSPSKRADLSVNLFKHDHLAISHYEPRNMTMIQLIGFLSRMALDPACAPMFANEALLTGNSKMVCEVAVHEQNIWANSSVKLDIKNNRNDIPFFDFGNSGSELNQLEIIYVIPRNWSVNTGSGTKIEERQKYIPAEVRNITATMSQGTAQMRVSQETVTATSTVGPADQCPCIKLIGSYQIQTNAVTGAQNAYVWVNGVQFLVW